MPCRNVRGVLAGQHDSAIDLAKIVIVIRPRLFGPVAGAPQRKGHAMPCHGNAVIEFGPVLRVDFATKLYRLRDSFGR